MHARMSHSSLVMFTFWVVAVHVVKIVYGSERDGEVLVVMV